MAKIFIVEDDASLREELKCLLELQDFTVQASVNFATIVEEILSSDTDCVILDLKLPNNGGHAVCREVRQKSVVPIIMLTSSASEFDEVMSMNLGADDYVCKPYKPAILLARIQSVLRRAHVPEQQTLITHKEVTLDSAKSLIVYQGKTSELTRNEFRIFKMLMENRGCIISRQDLMVELWESDAFIDDNTLTVNINRLRKNLSSLGVPEDFLITRRGQGYMV